MTARPQARVPAHQRGHSALCRLLAVDPETFATDHWDRQPLLSRAADLPSAFTDLFDNNAVDELVSKRGLRTPFLRVARDGATLSDRAFTSGGGLGAGIADQVSDDRLLGLFADGATLVLQGLHRTWPPLIEFAQRLAADLGHPVQVNAYVTPAQSTGFSTHYDVHDVFVLQVEGEKRWQIRPPVRPTPLRDEPWTARRAAVEAAAAGEPLLEATLRPGDCLYLPRGFLHAATALGGVSTHLTLGVHPWTRRHLADSLVARALARASEDPRVRQSLDVGASVGSADETAADVELVRSALLRAVADVDAADVVAALAQQERAAQRAAPLGPLAQALAAEALVPGQHLRLRPGVAARLSPAEDGYAGLDSRAGHLRIAVAEVPAVRLFLEEGAAQAGDLGLNLARQLMLGGVAVPE